MILGVKRETLIRWGTMMKCGYFVLTLLCSLAASAIGTVKHIIFEIDDVLFKVSEMETVKHIPVLASIGEKLAESYTSQYMELLANDHTYDFLCKEARPLFRNKRVPSLMAAFFLDAITAEQASIIAKRVISENVSWYDVVSKAAFSYAAQAEFDPKHEIGYMFPIDEVHALVERLSKNSENKLYIFSNKNSGTLRNLKRRYPKYFAPFEGRIFISGETKKLKPSRAAYQHLFDKYDINPNDAYFVEAQRGYIDPIKMFPGAKALRWSKDKAKEVEKALLK